MLFLSVIGLLAVSCDKEEPTQSAHIDTPVEPVVPSDTTQTEPVGDGIIPNAVTDIDGNHYDAVKLGEQVWMASNLHTTHFPNGEAIPDGGQSYSYTQAYRYTPDGNADVATYGYLYNWLAAMHGASSSSSNPSGVQGICPDGWHVPSDAEWTQLTDYCSSQSACACGGSSDYIAKALSADRDWLSSTESCAPGNDLTANNASNFSALPAGYFEGNASYNDFGYSTFFWCATAVGEDEAWWRYIDCNTPVVDSYYYRKFYGFSVRCIRDR